MADHRHIWKNQKIHYGIGADWIKCGFKDCEVKKKIPDSIECNEELK